MKVTIDPFAGFCFGVDRAVRIAEENLFGNIPLRSLGDLVHNEEENKRLTEKGLKTLSHEDLINLKHGRVLFRAHGEPPKIYKIACRNNTKVLDATCPVVKKLQTRVGKASKEVLKKDGMVIIHGRQDHPEIIGLVANTEGNVLVLENVEEVRKADLPPVVRMFAQTTRGTEDYLLMQDAVRQRLNELHDPENIDFKSFNTICGQVSGREKSIRKFASDHDVLLFVGGKGSSNGKLLFSLAKDENPNSYYISGAWDLRPEWFRDASTVGISGATSTPGWLMEQVEAEVEKY